MKSKRRIIILLSICLGIILCFVTNKQSVLADQTIDTEEVKLSYDPDSKILTIPMYVCSDGDSAHAIYLGYETAVLDEYLRVDTDSLYPDTDEISYDFSKDKDMHNRIFYDPENNKILSASHNNPSDGLYFTPHRIKVKLKFIDDQGQTVETDETTSKQFVELNKDTGEGNADELMAPEGYAIKSGQKVIHEIDDINNTEIHTLSVEKRQPYRLIVNRKIKGSDGKDLVDKLDEYIPYDTDITKFLELSKNDSFKPEIDYDKSVEISVSTASGNELPSLKFESKNELELSRDLSIFSMPDTAIFSGGTITINVNYQDYDDVNNPISYKLVVPSNLGNQVVQIDDGKLGSQITVAVPEIKGYKADKKTVLAKVNIDGTITTNEKVNYTKLGGGGSSSSSSDKHISNLDTIQKASTNTQANIYDNNVELINQTTKRNQDFETTKKMTKGNQTYYQFEDGKWINSNDVYFYDDIDGYFRTYGDSYKVLHKSDGTMVQNRALAAGTDWKTDRIAKVNDETYYRVATDEWVKAVKGTTYSPIQTIINVGGGTNFYDEKGQLLGKFDTDIPLITDRISNINSQKMYRVATNEYVLAD